MDNKKCVYYDTVRAETVSVAQGSPQCPATRVLLESTKRLRVFVIVLFLLTLIVVALSLYLASSSLMLLWEHGVSITLMVFAILLLGISSATLALSLPKYLEKPYLILADAS